MVCDYGMPKALMAYRWAEYSDNGTKQMDPEDVAWHFASEVELNVNQFKQMESYLLDWAVDGNVTFDDFWNAQPWSDEVCGWY